SAIDESGSTVGQYTGGGRWPITGSRSMTRESVLSALLQAASARPSKARGKRRRGDWGIEGSPYRPASKTQTGRRCAEMRGWKGRGGPMCNAARVACNAREVAGGRSATASASEDEEAREEAERRAAAGRAAVADRRGARASVVAA